MLFKPLATNGTHMCRLECIMNGPYARDVTPQSWRYFDPLFWPLYRPNASMRWRKYRLQTKFSLDPSCVHKLYPKFCKFIECSRIQNDILNLYQNNVYCLHMSAYSRYDNEVFCVI